MTTATQDIKVTCHNHVLKGSEARSEDGHPWRNWKISLVAMDNGEEVKGKLSMILNYIQYILHPTFSEPHRTRKVEPYVLQEKGWGEFDLKIVLYFKNDIANPQVLSFDLNFAQPTYSKVITLEFPNASSELIELLSGEPSSFSSEISSPNASRPRKGGKKPYGATRSSSIDKSGNLSPAAYQNDIDEDHEHYQGPSKVSATKQHLPSRKRKNSYTVTKEEEERAAPRSRRRSAATVNTEENYNRYREQPRTAFKPSSPSSKRKNPFSSAQEEEERAARRPRRTSDNIAIKTNEEEHHQFPEQSFDSISNAKSSRKAKDSVTVTQKKEDKAHALSRKPSDATTIKPTQEGHDQYQEQAHNAMKTPLPSSKRKNSFISTTDNEDGSSVCSDAPVTTSETSTNVIYTLKDVYGLSFVDQAELSKEIKQQLDIPVQVDMLELAKRFVTLTPEQNEDFQRLIVEYATDDVILKNGPDGSIQLDLFSCNRTLLAKLWDFVEELNEEDEEEGYDLDDSLSDDSILDPNYTAPYLL
ncbi:yeats family-domain-containing protein [Mycotypha africana]|uniref:yeats family-domain-containing protein n=1 Tax=Mycotypha africana TaxID=64632 RepID=UPI0023002D99|nr:yeats family-domain-containing protein [Mycotypha africana]KAI8970203.1 yeats family-domain-containing protein [Mycotypha africana]